MTDPLHPPHPLQTRDFGAGPIAWREHGAPDAPAIVLLHGIGSGSGSWAAVMAPLATAGHRVIAWDAPGYGGSAPLGNPAPLAQDYAVALEALVRGLELEACGPITLVGHSLGALIASGTAARAAIDVRTLVLASPAHGYGKAEPELRERKYRERIDALDQLGIAGMAEKRSAALVAPGSSEAVIGAVRANMVLASDGGYRQSAHLLAFDDTRTHLRTIAAARRCRAGVVCGSLDTVTPPKGARALAAEFGLPYREIDGIAHALYVEDAARFVSALRELMAAAVLRQAAA